MIDAVNLVLGLVASQFRFAARLEAEVLVIRHTGLTSVRSID
jgi:hypothetical protein